MAIPKCYSLILAGLLMVGMDTALAQSEASLTGEKNRLARMEQLQENRQVEIEELENELLSYDYKLEQAKEALEKARLKYEADRRELQLAKRDHLVNSTDDTERQLNKAEHGFAMAERGVDSRTRRVEFIQSNYDELNARLQEAREGIASGERRIQQQREKIDNLVAALLARAEEDRRKAALAEQVPVAASEAELPPPSVAGNPVVIPEQAEGMVPAEGGLEEASAAAPEASTEVLEASEASEVSGPALEEQPEAASPAQPAERTEGLAEAGSAGMPEEAQEVVREVDPELLDYVRRERQRLDRLLEDGDEGKETFRYLVLEPSRGESVPFESLGHDQYRLVAPVEAGRQTYKVNTWKFRRTIPEEDAQEPYVFILDARRLSRPRLVMYPQYALQSLEGAASQESVDARAVTGANESPQSRELSESPDQAQSQQPVGSEEPSAPTALQEAPAAEVPSEAGESQLESQVPAEPQLPANADGAAVPLESLEPLELPKQQESASP
ncbi:hypothetical protein Maes01_02167 [Microbulbifer aestuariivivens]|uniref:Uncharacterized protein n=1 Tax=Microbulbifer aestuariivivens TaxID=1908308 RepID=A0ABP9WU85_9GAMM